MKLAFIFLAALIMICSCQSPGSGSKADTADSTTIISSEKRNTMPVKEDFIQLLKKDGVPGDYYFDSSLLQTQMDYPGTVQVLDAFAQALPSLFVHSDSVKNADDLYVMVTTQPESFGLAANPTGEDVKKAILTEMNKDKGMTFYLLPENTETGSPEGAPLFPPEYGETVKDYWIWYLKCNFFPGPLWLLVKRDGSMPAYCYGYM